MKMILAIVASLIILPLAVGNSISVRYVLISDTTWPIGEAKPCNLDGKSHQGHCFPPEKLTTKRGYWHRYLVGVDFNKPPHFDQNQWAGEEHGYPYDIECRLDSYKHATCEVK
jgi:hypothetical protein